MTKQQGEQMIALLTQIRDALVPPEVSEPEGCTHPEDRRVDMSTLSDPAHIVCGVCRQRL